MVFKTLGKGIANAGSKFVNNKHIFRDMTEKELKEGSLYERMLGKKLTLGAGAALTAGTVGIGASQEMLNNSGNISKLGYTQVADNLDRLISIDGTGALNQMKELSNGNQEIMSDMVRQTFSRQHLSVGNANIGGVNGDLVFALNNLREG